MDRKVKGCFVDSIKSEPDEPWEDYPLPVAIREAIAERLNDEAASAA